MTDSDHEVRQPRLIPDDGEPMNYGESPPVSFEVTLLALSGIHGLGTKGIKAITTALRGDLHVVWDLVHEDLYEALEHARVPAARRITTEILDDASSLIQRGEDLFESLVTKGIIVMPWSKLPPQLRAIPDPPRWLFVQGEDVALHQRPVVAIVGTRQPSRGGIMAAQRVSEILSAYPITLVSGLAEGIDATAHATTLPHGVINIAFLGHGINEVFPRETASVRERIVDQGGAVASEYLPDERYQKIYFVERNRLQAALADIVIPVEAKIKSGTAHTVNFARTYNRKIIGIRWPGSNGIVSELEHQGHRIVDILTREGCRMLDYEFRHLAEEEGIGTFPLSRVARLFQQEMALRNIRSEDLEALIQVLWGVARENKGGQ